MSEALVIVDIQNDYFKDGRFELENSKQALAVAKNIIASFRKKNSPIIYVQHISKAGSPFFEPNTEGVKIHQDIIPKPDDYLVIKHFPNSFLDTNLDATLKDLAVSDLVVIGMMTHMCIDTTVRAAKEQGYNVTLIADATATRALELNGELTPASYVQRSFLAALNGTFAKVINAQEYLKS